jgi:hypothetical protein
MHEMHEMHECTNAPMHARRRRPRVIAIALCAFVHWCIFAFPCLASAETIDRVLAVVAGQPITLSDVTAARELGLQPIATGSSADPVRSVLNALIDRELILAEVERYAPAEPSTDAIDRQVAQVRSRFATADTFAAALAHGGLSEKDLRARLREDLRIAAYLDQRFAAAQTRRQALLDDWLAGLRNRGDIVDLYLTRN